MNVLRYEDWWPKIVRATISSSMETSPFLCQCYGFLRMILDIKGDALLTILTEHRHRTSTSVRG